MRKEPNRVTGAHLKKWGHPPSPRFPELIARAAALRAEGLSHAQIRDALAGEIPPAPNHLPLRPAGALAFHETIEAEDADEQANLEAVRATMRAVMRTPTVEAGAAMPDACPSGPVGTIPVGGVIAARNAIHPGMHSADICCSVMISDLGDADPKAVLDAASAVTHFGFGGRRPDLHWPAPADLLEEMGENRFCSSQNGRAFAKSHFGTQGDGNHFLFVGRSAATGRTAMVTHHGSRGPGAMVYREGMAVAERFRQALSPATLKQNAWIPADTEEGRAYWAALQLIRRWTRANHGAIHDRVAAGAGAEVQDRFWNEHNFVFQRGGLFYHGKGATPAWDGYAEDATGLTLIPLNMAQPVLVTRGRDAAHGLGFAPHGAGRNFSRAEHRRRMGTRTAEQAFAAETQGLDVRFHAGAIDPSELPSGYKNAEAVTRRIEAFGLAEIVDRIEPFGCIMAGDQPKPWMKKKGKKAAAAAQ